ncbi:MAG: polysaccharide biosynthesis/export family protein [Verrucomicrobiota bacterium JB023]|nr:polysaccharide biosynthesis/export family protein [Verrucomicrobiota bacterium JB023]
MKTVSVSALAIYLFCSQAFSSAESLSPALLRAELTLVSAKSAGLAERHPAYQAAEKKVGELKAKEVRRDDEYYLTAQKELLKLEKEISTLNQVGLGNQHPRFRALADQISMLEKLNVATVRPGDTFSLKLLGFTEQEAKRWDDDYTVSKEGDIHLPLVGKIKIQGLSVRSAERKIEEKLMKEEIYKRLRIMLQRQ